jgi:trehalose-6-phosphate synthase
MRRTSEPRQDQHTRVIGILRGDIFLGNEIHTVTQWGHERNNLSKEDHHEYYNGFTNRVLWPILHYRIDLAEFSRRDLSGYLRVNDHFARELHEVLGPDDIIWVNDYHLMPLAKAVM